MICPYCKETIQDGALVCRYCQHTIYQPIMPTVPTAFPTAPAPQAPNKLDIAIIQFTNQGWVVTAKEKAFATLRKARPINWVVLIAVFLVCSILGLFFFGIPWVVPFVVYLIFYYHKFDTLTLIVEEDGEVRQYTGTNIPAGYNIQPVNPQDEGTPRRAIIITIVVFVAMALIIVGIYFGAKALIADISNNASGIANQICGPFQALLP